MHALCREAVARRVSIGAHVGYRDRDRFGRRALDVPPEIVEAETAEQVAALQEVAHAEGGHVGYVKLHGALYDRSNTDADSAAAVVRELQAARIPAVLAFPDSELIAQAAAARLAIATEGFADRAYAPDGTLVPRTQPGAILDEETAVAQALRLAEDQQIRSLCIHGDTPDALTLARQIIDGLHEAGIELLQTAVWRVTTSANRVGIRLDGALLSNAHAAGSCSPKASSPARSRFRRNGGRSCF